MLSQAKHRSQITTKIMAKRVTKDNWVYEYESVPKYRVQYDYELTDVRYILGEMFNMEIKKTLICIGINPSTAMPDNLDQTLIRVQKYAKQSGEYGAWYMLNVYSQRATNPEDMHKDMTYDKDIHAQNIKSITALLGTLSDIDVWCAWGSVIDDSKRKFLSDLLYGNNERSITGLISLFDANHTIFKAYGATKKGYPSHPVVMPKDAVLKDINAIPQLQSLYERIKESIKQK